MTPTCDLHTYQSSPGVDYSMCTCTGGPTMDAEFDSGICHQGLG